MIKVRWQLFYMKLRLSSRSLAWLFSHARYTVFALFTALFVFEFVYWMLKLPVFWTLMASANLSVLDKLSLLYGPFSYVQVQNGSVITTLMLLLAAVQGLSLAALVYIIRHQPKTDGLLIGEGAFIGFLTLIGLGCPACGTSLVAPVMAIFVSGSVTAASQIVTRIILPLALAVGLYGLYVLGLRVSTIRAHHSDETVSKATIHAS